MIDQYNDARKVGVPLIAISTPDQAATLRMLANPETTPSANDGPFISWNIVEGVKPHNSAGRATIQEKWGDDGNIQTVLPSVLADVLDFVLKTTPNEQQRRNGVKSPLEALTVALLNTHRYLNTPDSDAVIQAICQLRDALQPIGGTIIMLGTTFELPPEIASDVLSLDEPRPSRDEISRAIDQTLKDALGDEYLTSTNRAGELRVTEQDVESSIEALTGLTMFGVQQATALSLVKGKLNPDVAWARKEQMINAQRGLKIELPDGTFDDVGGCRAVKDEIIKIQSGPGAANVIVFIDEIDKTALGASGALSASDSGVSSDQVGQFLQFMADTKALGIMFFGVPGAGKSAIAKKAGVAIAGKRVPVIRADFGGTKSKFVGESEMYQREMYKVISAVGNGRTLVIATCNRVNAMSPEMLRRFNVAKFFFDVSDSDEKETIWRIYLTKRNMLDQWDTRPDDTGWTGAEIERCVENAWLKQQTLRESAATIIPLNVTQATLFKELRQQAHNNFLSASYPGAYQNSDIYVRSEDGQPTRRFTIGMGDEKGQN